MLSAIILFNDEETKMKINRIEIPLETHKKELEYWILTRLVKMMCNFKTSQFYFRVTVQNEVIVVKCSKIWQWFGRR